MKQRKWGRITNVLNPFAKALAGNSAPTSVSHAAGMALTKVMANEGSEHNILVNALLIGLIMSDQWVKRHAAQAPNMDFDEFAKRIAKARRLAASVRRKSSPTSPASSPPSRAPTSPAQPSMSMAADPPWSSVRL